MSSILQTTCPKCGGVAEWCADDNVTYCKEPPIKDRKTGKMVKCDYFGVEEQNRWYTPSDYR